ncbi:hypothetical protein BJ878DRAFT_545593 [Calycina marina]|uniref:FAD-binding PCMH-type domain-containing protein n=1 Tax=Calycina marina TaxID=1763456 RepID=A0A9P8CBZ6_9HELO|nr:hypothetical protein BJ878DRAFT_545593 [Calycina marina]
MGAAQSTPVIKALKQALDNDDDLYAFPGRPLYQLRYVKPYNMDRPVKPAAITYPKTKEQVAAIVKVAADFGLKVQPRSGGHSYANYCLGGVNGCIVIDLKRFQQFKMDEMTWNATVGAGTLLGDVTKRMHDAGNRAVAHGTCPQVGVGGQATIGGLGPSSRMWGSLLDHISEMEVVLADSSIVRASATQNTDIFWACRGAGASFGIVTEFILRTKPEPGEAIQYSFSFTGRPYASLAKLFKKWQTFVADPKLTRKFATSVVITELGMVITGTFFGSRAEYDALQLSKLFPGSANAHTVVLKDWLGTVASWAEDAALQLGGGIASPIYTKSMTFNGCHLIPDAAIERMFAYLDIVKKGTPIWFIIFDLEGGAINDVPAAATAYAHRDALFYMQSYAVGIPKLRARTRGFLRGFHDVLLKSVPGGDTFGAYAGYVDPELTDGQRQYWRGNLSRLEEIKAEVDPGEVFWNPQSVRPAGGVEMEKMGRLRKTERRRFGDVFCGLFC